MGREALITRTCEMLMQMPPNKITRAEVARHMNVDPSLIRYYFRDRATLLLAAVARLTAELSRLMDEELARSDPDTRREPAAGARVGAAETERHPIHSFTA